MLTECPSCSTVFRVTSAILKIGHGQVRCGKCRTQFDALESLLDEDHMLQDAGNDKTENESQADATESPAIEAREPDIAEEITLEGSRIEISGTYRVPTELRTASDPSQPQVVHEHVVIDRDQPVDDDRDADDAIDNGSVADDDIIEISLDDGEPVADAASHLLADVAPDQSKSTARRFWQRHPSSKTDAHAIDAELAALTHSPLPAPPRKVWTIATVALLALLIAQMVHHNRDTLVRNPTYGGAISNVYRAFGLTLTPWDVHDYDLQQWGVVVDNTARDALRVRASVTNAANFSQPYPLIKLVLEDRWGAPVAMREFSPVEYLPSTAIANRMMAPRQRSNAEIVIVDPGVDAVGFQLHACLPRDGGIVCSDDLPAKKAP